MNILCSQCRWWGKSPGTRGNPHLRACANPKHVMGYQDSSTVPDDGMIVESDE